MNDAQKKAAEYAEILLAFSRGEKLQFQYQNGKWVDRSCPNLMPSFGKRYRIAPGEVTE